eukprot:EG_transcript_7978
MAPLGAIATSLRTARPAGRAPRRGALAARRPAPSPGHRPQPPPPAAPHRPSGAPDAEWELVPRWNSLVLVETPLTLEATLAHHRSSIDAAVEPSLHLVEVGASAADWPALVAAAESTARRRAELAAAADWLAVARHCPHLTPQSKWADVAADLLAEEPAARAALEEEQGRCWAAVGAVERCQAAEGSGRAALRREAKEAFEDLLDHCQWEMPSRQAVLFYEQLDRMLGRMVATLVAVEARERVALLAEQEELRGELRAEKARLRRLVIMKRRYPNAPEVLGTETPMHAYLCRFRFPAPPETDAVLPEPQTWHRPCDVWGGSNDDLQCMTPEASTPMSGAVSPIAFAL